MKRLAFISMRSPADRIRNDHAMEPMRTVSTIWAHRRGLSEDLAIGYSLPRATCTEITMIPAIQINTGVKSTGIFFSLPFSRDCLENLSF